MAVFTDGFVGTPGALISARVGWTTATGADANQIAPSGDGVSVTTGTGSTVTRQLPSSQPSSADQYAQAMLLASDNGPFLLGVRINSSGEGYYVRRGAGGTNGILQLYRRSGTAFTLLGSFTSTSDSVAFPTRLQAVGNQISVVSNVITLIGPITDSNFPTGSVGFLTRGGSVAATSRLDDWQSGEVSSSSDTSAPVGLAISSSEAFALAARSLKSVGLSVEADTAFALATRSIRSVGLSIEADTAFALSIATSGAVGLALEADTPFALASLQRVSVGFASEADSALKLDAAIGGAVGAATEVSLAYALASVLRAPVGLAAEADTASALGTIERANVGIALEQDFAVALTSLTSGSVGVAIEYDEASELSFKLITEVGLAVEYNEALALSGGIPIILTVRRDRIIQGTRRNRIVGAESRTRIV